MIKFRCQRCSQKIAVNDEGIGAVIACPTCVESMIVPMRSDREFVPRFAEAIPLELTPDVPAVTPVEDAMRPHLARLLANRLLQTLLWHRRELLQTQEIATDQLAALEQRLVLVQIKFQRRLGYYQERIALLEAENRELSQQVRLMSEDTPVRENSFGDGRVNLRDGRLMLSA